MELKTSEKLICTLCNPEEKVCIDGSAGDKQILQEAISEVLHEANKILKEQHAKGREKCTSS